MSQVAADPLLTPALVSPPRADTRRRLAEALEPGGRRLAAPEILTAAAAVATAAGFFAVTGVAQDVLERRADWSRLSGWLLLLAGAAAVRTGASYLAAQLALDGSLAVERHLCVRLLDRLLAGAGSSLGSAAQATAVMEEVERVGAYAERYQPARVAATMVPLVLLGAVFPRQLGGRGAPRSMRAAAAAEPVDRRDGRGGRRPPSCPGAPSSGAQGRAAAAVTGELERFARSRRRLTRLEAGGPSVGTLLADLTLLAVVATAARALGTGELPAPAFGAVCLVAIAVFETVVTLPASVTARAGARAACARLTEAFPRGTPAAARPDLGPAWPAMLEIRLEAQNAELALSAGDTLLITGPSGTGKSTILRAISGQSGPGVDVHLDGVDAAAIDPEALAGHVTLVAQDAHIFDGTVRDNLLLAAPDAGDPELWRALAAAALDDTIAGSPRASTPRSAPEARPSQAGSAAACRSPRACYSRQRCCCSTSPPKDLTPAPPLVCSPESGTSTKAPCW